MGRGWLLGLDGTQVAAAQSWLSGRKHWAGECHHWGAGGRDLRSRPGPYLLPESAMGATAYRHPGQADRKRRVNACVRGGMRGPLGPQSPLPPQTPSWFRLDKCVGLAIYSELACTPADLYPARHLHPDAQEVRDKPEVTQRVVVEPACTLGPRILPSLLRVTSGSHHTFWGAGPRRQKTWVRVLALPPKVLPDPENAPNFWSRTLFSKLVCTGPWPCLGHKPL